MLVIFSTPIFFLFGRHRTNGCDLPRGGCIRAVKEPRGSVVAVPRYAAPRVQTLAQFSRSVRDREWMKRKRRLQHRQGCPENADQYARAALNFFFSVSYTPSFSQGDSIDQTPQGIPKKQSTPTW
jgi:hypothetical protein